jgi:hypothetical protein
MSDPGDLIGLMHKDETSGRSVFLPPYWWPAANQPIVLFLDELNRARPEILQAVFDLALNRRLAGKSLPPGSRVVAAINHGDEYQLTELDPALLSRFNLYEFTPTVEDWLVWGKNQALDGRVLDFIQANPLHLDGAKTCTPKPLPAWWERQPPWLCNNIWGQPDNSARNRYCATGKNTRPKSNAWPCTNWFN